MSNIETLKIDEGFRGQPYKDSLGFLTIGYGCKLPLDREEAELLLNHRYQKTVSKINSFFYNFELPDIAMSVLYNMAYQLGVPGLLKFKRMISALKNKNYLSASVEMQDSRWYKQTPNRAKRLIKIMEEL